MDQYDQIFDHGKFMEIEIKTKVEIISDLKELRNSISVVIEELEELDTTSDKKTNRLLVNTITFTLFGFIDKITDVELNIYNYMRSRDT